MNSVPRRSSGCVAFQCPNCRLFYFTMIRCDQMCHKCAQHKQATEAKKVKSFGNVQRICISNLFELFSLQNESKNPTKQSK